MTSLDVAVGPIGYESSSVAVLVDDGSCPGNIASVGRVGFYNHSTAENCTAIRARCSCKNCSIYIPGVTSSGCLDNIPGETTTE